MKAAMSSKAEGTLPVKKVVKKVPAKAGASLVAAKSAVGSSLAPRKDGVSKLTIAQAKPTGSKTQESNVELRTDSSPVSTAQVALKPKPTTGNIPEEQSASKKPSDINKAGEKPKTKKVIVKKKVVVVKKVSSSAASSALKPAKTLSPVNVPEKLLNLESEATKQQVPDTGRDLPLQNLSWKEEKPVSLASEKPQKVVKKVVAKGKGGMLEAKKEKQDIEAAIEQNIEAPVQPKVEAYEKINNLDNSKSAAQEALPPKEELEADEVIECETVDVAAEELQLYDDIEFEEEPEFEEDAPEKQGTEIGEDYQLDTVQTRPVSERQKRKKLEVFVGGLDKDATEDDVRAAFQPVGDIVEVRLMMNPLTGKNKGYAFVRFATSEQAGKAVTQFAAIQICGKECGVLPNQDNDTLFIGNISRDWKSSEVLQKLKEFGVSGIEELTLIADPHNEALNRGYAFLELATHHDAVNAFQRLHRPGIMFGYDWPAKVSWAQPLNEDAALVSKVKSVFVDGIPPNWTEDKVKQSFGKFGDIERIVLARNMAFSKRKDFAFVNFTTNESALDCVEAFRDMELSDGDRKVKVKVSFTRPIQKGRADKWSAPRQRGPAGQGRGQAGRGEGWFSNRFGSRGTGRGFGWSGNRVIGCGGKRLYDEHEVWMMIKAVREEEGWPSGARGRGGRYGRPPRGMGRGAYDQHDESGHYEARHGESYREQTDPDYTYDGYTRPASDFTASRGKIPRPGPMTDDYESQHLGPYSRSRVSQHPDHFRSPHHEGAHHQRYEQGWNDEGVFIGSHDYKDVGVGTKRPASTWDGDYTYHDSGHRGNPRARADYLDSAHFPENVAHYSDHMRSPAGPATQALGMRPARSGREGPIPSFYESGSGLSKAGMGTRDSGGLSKVGMGTTYNDHSYNTILPETSNYLPEAPEKRDMSMYPSSFYGGHSDSAGYNFQTPGYY